MSTDLERALSDALHTITPEPPTSYRFTPSEQLASDAAVPVDVIDLDAARQRRRPRYGALLAAAAVVVLGAGIAVAAVAVERSDTAPAGPDRKSAPFSTVPSCTNDDILITMPRKPVIGAGTVLVTAAQKNFGSGTCNLGSTAQVSFADGAGGSTPFRAATATKDALVLRTGDSLVYTARLRSAGTCRPDDAGATDAPGIQLEDDGYGYQLDLPIRGCTLTPLGLSVRTER